MKVTEKHQKRIPLLVTMDLEVAWDHDLLEQARSLERLRDDLRRVGVPLTVFVTADAAAMFRSEVLALARNGHEIGCHGLGHRRDENYRDMEPGKIRETISQGTEQIQAVVGRRPTCFRGPSMTTSAATHLVLVEEGYAADFSVCSQRLDTWNSKGGSLGWLLAPRHPYHSNEISPYRRGDIPIWIVPMRCIGLPFISGSLFLFGLAFMKTLGRILMMEAHRSGAPVVYLFHPYEFATYTGKREGRDTGSARRKLLHRLYRQNREWRYNANLALIEYMVSFDGAVPMSSREYVAELEYATELRGADVRSGY